MAEADKQFFDESWIAGETADQGCTDSSLSLPDPVKVSIQVGDYRDCLLQGSSHYYGACAGFLASMAETKMHPVLVKPRVRKNKWPS